jgi:aspartate kinase
VNVAVKKFGGSSLATLDRVRHVARRVAQAAQSGADVIVVVSARGKTTDELLELAAAVSPERPGREIDQLLATGESSSAALLALTLCGLGVPAVSLTGRQAGIHVEGIHGSGVVSHVDTARILRHLTAGEVVVVAGFQGVNDLGDVVTLGRGGSDTTAVALAAELKATTCEIYTDVNGVYTADPRVVPDARLQSNVDPSVMAEMAFSGAKVLHSRAVELAAVTGVEVLVANTFSDKTGTWIRPERVGSLESRGVVVGVTHDLDVARVLVQSTGTDRDLAADVLGVLATQYAPVDLVARSGANEDEFRMGFTIRRSDVREVQPRLQEALADVGAEIRIDENVGKVSLVGMGLLNRPQYTARMMSTLSSANISTSWISTSQLRTSVTMPLAHTKAAISALHREFEPEWNEIDQRGESR